MSYTQLSRRNFLGTSAALSVGAALWPRYSASAENRVLRISSIADMQIIDPLNRKGRNEEDIMGAIFEKLIEYKVGENFDWELQAATSIEQVDPTHIKFSLRPGIAWTNGFGEVTSEDVKFSYERIADPSNNSPYRDDWALLDHVDTIDEYQGVIVLKEPFAPLFSSTLPYGSGCIVCKKAVEALPEKTFTVEPPATCGPYVIEQWTPKQKLVLKRNPLWTGPRPDFDEVHIFPIEDAKAAELAFDANELDAAQIAISSIPRYKKELPKGVRLSVRPPLEYFWVSSSFVHPNFSDVRVRQAIQYAIDVDEVLAAAFNGVADPSTGIVAPSLVGHRANRLVGKRDLDKARELLAQAGRPKGFKTTLDTAQQTDYVTAAQVIQSNLAEVGIEVEIRAADTGSFWNLGFDSNPTWKDLQMLLMSYSMAPDPSWATVWFTSAQIGQWNWERFKSPEFDELHKKGLVELDPIKRQLIYARMQDLMEESGCYTFLTHGASGHIYRDNIVPGWRADGANSIFRKFRIA